MEYFYRKFKLSASLVFIFYGLKTMDMCAKDFNNVDQIWFAISVLSIMFGSFMLDTYVDIVKLGNKN